MTISESLESISPLRADDRKSLKEALERKDVRGHEVYVLEHAKGVRVTLRKAKYLLKRPEAT